MLNLAQKHNAIAVLIPNINEETKRLKTKYKQRENAISTHVVA